MGFTVRLDDTVLDGYDLRLMNRIAEINEKNSESSPEDYSTDDYSAKVTPKTLVDDKKVRKTFRHFGPLTKLTIGRMVRDLTRLYNRGLLDCEVITTSEIERSYKVSSWGREVLSRYTD